MGKGDTPRPCSTTHQERDLRWLLLEGEITKAAYNRRFAKLKRARLIQRDGRVLK